MALLPVLHYQTREFGIDDYRDRGWRDGTPGGRISSHGIWTDTWLSVLTDAMWQILLWE